MQVQQGRARSAATATQSQSQSQWRSGRFPSIGRIIGAEAGDLKSDTAAAGSRTADGRSPALARVWGLPLPFPGTQLHAKEKQQKSLGISGVCFEHRLVAVTMAHP